MDIADYAQIHTEHEIEIALLNRQTQNQSVSSTECLDCGEPIPEKHRLAVPGCDKCVECQEISDRV